MFGAEVRFYREVAPVCGVRVAACYSAEEADEGTCLVLEDLSGWQPGADPLAAARVLSVMHRRWQGRVHVRWPWLRSVGAAADLVADLFDRVWWNLAARRDVTDGLRDLGDRLVGRVVSVAGVVAMAGPLTLVHGDAALRNWRTSLEGEVALLDWEDVSAAPGVADLAWLLLSSVEPAQWEEVIEAYGPAQGLDIVLPASVVQGLLSLAPTVEGSPDALGWVRRLDAAGRRLSATS